MGTKERADALRGVLYTGEYCINWEVTIFIYEFPNKEEKLKQNDRCCICVWRFADKDHSRVAEF